MVVSSSLMVWRCWKKVLLRESGDYSDIYSDNKLDRVQQNIKGPEGNSKAKTGKAVIIWWISNHQNYTQHHHPLDRIITLNFQMLHCESSSRINKSQMELVEELTKLNASLRLELDKCHQYIQALERDLTDAENRNNFSVISDREISGGGNIEEERSRLRGEVDRLRAKVKEKKHLCKNLGKHCQQLEGALNEVLRQRGQLQISLANMQCWFDNKIGQDKEKVGKLEAVVAEQRATIQLYSKELQGKAVLTEKLYNRVEGLQRQRGFIAKENDDLRQLNFSLTQKVQQIQRRFQQREIKASQQLRDLQNKHLAALNEVNRSGISQYRGQVYNSRVGGASTIIESSSRAWPVAKRISIEQHSVVKQAESDRQQILQQLRLLQEQSRRQKQKVEMLKNDIITIKLEHSNLLTKNSQLSQQITRLERTKSQLVAKLQGSSSIRTIKQTQRSIEDVNSLKSSCNKTATTIGSVSIRKHPMTPQDGEVPVQDKGCLKGQYVYLTNSLVDTRKSSIVYRQSAVNFTTLR